MIIKTNNLKKNNFIYRESARIYYERPFYMVRSSPRPFVISQTLFIFILTLVNFLHYTKYSSLAAFTSFGAFLLPVFFRFRDILRESTYIGLYTIAVQKNLRLGMILFIISEIMFFFSLFWALVYFALFFDAYAIIDFVVNTCEIYKLSNVFLVMACSQSRVDLSQKIASSF